MENNNFKYQKCVDQIIKYISDNSLSEGDKLPPEPKLTEIFQVSRITVRRAIDDLEQQGIVKKIQGSGTFVKFSHPKEPAAVKYLHFVLSENTNDGELLKTIRGADKFLSEHSYYLRTHFTYGDAEKERNSILELSAGGETCIMIFPKKELINCRFYQEMERKGMRFVFLDRMPPCVSGNLVQCDNVKGGYLATSHLIQQGYKKIAFFSRRPKSDASTLPQRLLGYQNALEEYGMPYRSEFVTFVPHEEETKSYFEKIITLDDHPDAFFCASDTTAVEIMYYLEKNSFSIPKDIAVIGFDNSSILQRLPFSLSTIEQSFYDLGYQAAKTAYDIIEKKLPYNIQKTLPVKLIARKST